MKYYVIGLVVTLALLAGCSEKKELDGLDKLPLDLVAGKTIAEASCIGCHGMDGKGVMDDIPNLAAQHEAYLLKIFQHYDHGKRTRSSGNVMEISEELTPQQLRNVVGYYASLPPLANSSTKSERYSYYDRGQALSESCTTCHGRDGNPIESGIPRLAGQHPQYLVKAINAYQDGTRTMPVMHEQIKELKQADMENIALYFALQAAKLAPSLADNPYEGKVFTYGCTECHGSKGSSKDAVIPNLAGQDVSYLRNMLKAYRGDGREHRQMHQLMVNLTDQEIDKIALFFAAEQPKPVTFMQPEAIYSLAKKCARCHNQQIANPEVLAPKLEGQNSGYLINALTVYRDGERGSSTMHRMSAIYADATIEGIATYYSAQPAK